MAVVQTGRYSEILDKRGAQGVLCGMDAEFVKKSMKPSTRKACVNKWTSLISKHGQKEQTS